jgi:putative ABC transport system ATP-binding protein
VLFAGEDVSRHSDAGLARLRRRIGFIAQDLALIAGLPAWENVTYSLIPRGVARRERRRIAIELLGWLGLADRLTAKPRQLSGGEQQRLAVARALAGRPELIIADEPTSNLDDESGRVVIDLLLKARANHATLVVASHDPRFAPYAMSAVQLSGGRRLVPDRADTVVASGH